MDDEKNTEAFSIDENHVLVFLGASCLLHAAAWFALRDPSPSHDPFVGAEGLVVFAILFIAVGVTRLRRLQE